MEKNGKNIIKNDNKDVFEELEDNIKIIKKVHESAKELGYDYISKKLKDNNFPNPEEMTKEMLEGSGDENKV